MKSRIPALLGLLALTGCTKVVTVESTSPPTTVRKTTTTVASEPAQSVLTPEDEYLLSLALLTDYADDMNTDLVLELGRAVCRNLRGGSSLDDVAEIVVGTEGADDAFIQFAAEMTAAAVWFLCPDQQWKIG